MLTKKNDLAGKLGELALRLYHLTSRHWWQEHRGELAPVCVYIIYEIIWVYSFWRPCRLRFGSITMINSGISPELTQCWPRARREVWGREWGQNGAASVGRIPSCGRLYGSDQYAASGASLSHFHRHDVAFPLLQPRDITTTLYWLLRMQSSSFHCNLLFTYTVLKLPLSSHQQGCLSYQSYHFHRCANNGFEASFHNNIKKIFCCYRLGTTLESGFNLRLNVR